MGKVPLITAQHDDPTVPRVGKSITEQLCEMQIGASLQVTEMQAQ